MINPNKITELLSKDLNDPEVLEFIYGSPKCPKCGENIITNDLYMTIVDTTFNYIEVEITCTNDDCQKRLTLHYIRSRIELQED